MGLSDKLDKEKKKAEEKAKKAKGARISKSELIKLQK
jgi:hypothetical protein